MSYLQLFWSMFRISAITFGGGYTIVPVIMDEFCKKRRLIEEDKMLDIIALAQSSPGAIAVSTAFLTGYAVKGRRGAILGVVAAVLPPLIIISVIYFAFYQTFATNFWVRAVLQGMSGAIAAAMIHSVYTLGKAALKKNVKFSIIIMILSFALSTFTSISTVLIIFGLALTGLIYFGFIVKDEGDKNGLV